MDGYTYMDLRDYFEIVACATKVLPEELLDRETFEDYNRLEFLFNKYYPEYRHWTLEDKSKFLRDS